MFFFDVTKQHLILTLISIIIISVVLILLYRYKLERFLGRQMDLVTPEPGDILLFFSRKFKDLPDLVFWNGLMTLHTNIPNTHYAVVLDDTYYLDSRRPGKSMYDNITKGEISGYPRLAKLKHIDEDWVGGDIMVIKTGQSVDSKKREEILREFNREGYWKGGGCLGNTNKIQKMIDPMCPLFLSVEGILRHYEDARIGRLKV
jgi:hypothetical protein